MKLFNWKKNIVCLFAFIVFTLPLFSQEAASQKLTISFNKQNLASSLESITQQTGVRFYHEGKELDQVEKKYTASFSSRPLFEVLNYLLKETGFAWKEVNGRIIIKRNELPAQDSNRESPAAKQKNVRPKDPGKVGGKIVDIQSGDAIVGATVKIGTRSTVTDVNGSFLLILPPGAYTARISYVGYGIKEITEIVVKENETFPLNVTLKREKGQLSEVVVTASAKKEGVNALLVRQKNAVEVSNGISAEQIGRTPDKNIGESLKRISGVSSIDNKFVLVRGIGERYNAAMLDGVVLPSTEAQQRNFSFDLIPSSLVDNVVVSKTATPDMNVSFGGGLIQINTKEIPNENFMSFTAGASYNDQSTGKDFYSHKRGSKDYLGFDDGRRKFPDALEHTDRTIAPNIELTPEAYEKKLTDQSRKFTNDNFTVYKYKTAPSQNYQFTVGQLLFADPAKEKRFGFTASVSYRNTQTINHIDKQIRGDFLDDADNAGAAYVFNTTWGGLLNAGLQLGKNRFSFRNIYTHMFDNTLVRQVGYDEANGPVAFKNRTPPNFVLEADDPTFIDLLQNKLGGQHAIGKAKLEWDLARTSISRTEKDLGISVSSPTLVSGEYKYYHVYQVASEPRILPLSRHHYDNKEKVYSWSVSATVPFNSLGIRNSIKTGYFGNRREAGFKWQIASLVRSGNSAFDERLLYLPISEAMKPENFSVTKGFFYAISPFWLDEFEGRSRSHALYTMIDSRLTDKLRLVWGIRAEYYKYTEKKNGNNEKLTVYSLKPDREWEWLPSANLTFSPTSEINVRAAFSSSVVRPEMMDNSQFWRYSPYLGAQFGNQGLYSTRINSVDVKAEWFPGAGEIISAGVFYKKFDRPAELTVTNISGNINYYLKSADWATVYGLELEVRKNLSFISDSPILGNIMLYSNLTLQQSKVLGTYLQNNPDPDQPAIQVTNKQDRPMYGQSPYLLNGGIQYTGNRLGLNLVYNKSGYKTYIVSDDPTVMEFERPREQLDAQISYKIWKKKVEFKLNAGNLLDAASTFYRNTGSYEPNPDYVPGGGDISGKMRFKEGFTNKYEEGDMIMFRQTFGRTYSLAVTYNF